MLPLSLVILLAFMLTGEAIKLPESSQVALEAGNTLLPSQPLVNKVGFEISGIRKNFKSVSSIFHQPAWSPGELLTSGDLSPVTIQRLNSSAYAPVQVETIGNFATKLLFSRPYNPVVLSRNLQAEYGIMGHPNGLLGRSQTITYNVYRREYTFYQGSGDCPSGCIENYYWVFKEYPDGFIRLLRKSSGTPPSSLAVKYESKPYTYAPSKDEGIEDGGKIFVVQGTGVLAAKLKV